MGGVTWVLTVLPLVMMALMLAAMGLQAHQRINGRQDAPPQRPRTVLPPVMGWAIFAAAVAFVLITELQRPCHHNCAARFLTALPLALALLTFGAIALVARRRVKASPATPPRPPPSLLLSALRWATLAVAAAIVLITVWERMR